jgi:proteic killer suppression protein
VLLLHADLGRALRVADALLKLTDRLCRALPGLEDRRLTRTPFGSTSHPVIKRVVITERAKKQLQKCPPQVQKKLRAWAAAIEQIGVDAVRKVPGYHDEPLAGARDGQRSIRLNQAYRAFYVVKGEALELRFLAVIDVNKHDY